VLNRNKNKHYKKTKEFFKKDVLRKSGFYDTNDSKIYSKMKKRKMWELYLIFLRYVTDNLENLKSVAEIGCGMGNFILELKKYDLFTRIIGVDFLIEPINLANNKKDLFNRVNFIQGDLLSLPFRDNSFDVSFCLNVLHHIHQDDFEIAISELARISRKIIVLEIRNKNYFLDFLYNFCILPCFYRGLPLSAYKIDDVNKIMRENGFILELIKGKNSIIHACRRIVLLYMREN
jgi:ubiquinone/menaquinone biosynthesis C-methylase UbiE